MRTIYACLLGVALATPALADFAKVTRESDFKTLVSGKTLSRPMIRLQVSPSGGISGKGLRKEVRGQWRWQDGYFCRDLNWGQRALGYNCQQVEIDGRTIRFTSDRGAGDFADFQLK